MIIRENDLSRIIDLARLTLPGGTRIWAYGSRVTGEAEEGSDLDLMLDSSSPKIATQLRAFKNALTDSNIPILVNTFLEKQLPDSWRLEIEKNKQLILEL